MEIPIVYENAEEGEVSPDCQFSGPGSAGSGNKLDLLELDNKKVNIFVNKSTNLNMQFLGNNHT